MFIFTTFINRLKFLICLVNFLFCIFALLSFYNIFVIIYYFCFNRSLNGGGRSMATIHILDCPGFQNPATCGRIMGAGLEDLCHNYTQERLQSLFHDSTFLTQQERYLQVKGKTAF